mgnify:CR=1 FL=1
MRASICQCRTIQRKKSEDCKVLSLCATWGWRALACSLRYAHNTEHTTHNTHKTTPDARTMGHTPHTGAMLSRVRNRLKSMERLSRIGNSQDQFLLQTLGFYFRHQSTKVG